MSKTTLFRGAQIFDGRRTYDNKALLIGAEKIIGIIPPDNAPDGCEIIDIEGGLLAPAFVDLQVNGGGGVLFNDAPCLEAIKTICASHSKFGTGAILVTMITDTPEKMHKAVNAGLQARNQSVPGFLGLHLEGPHISAEKKGAHDARFICPMSDDDLTRYIEARHGLPQLMITVAPEMVRPEQIEKLTMNGVIVSLGHSAAGFATVEKAIAAGAKTFTHLFNAMSPLTHREPGMVGAVLYANNTFAGLIADGIHVDPAVISIVLAVKKGSGKIFLVTDAMSVIGTELTSFTLNDRTILRRAGRLELEDGTLAGADLDMNSAVKYMVEAVGVSVEEALKMASLYPAQCIGCDPLLGRLEEGSHANFIHITDSLNVTAAWIGGHRARSQKV